LIEDETAPPPAEAEPAEAPEVGSVTQPQVQEQADAARAPLLDGPAGRSG
jgi:hypothetical protein